MISQSGRSSIYKKEKRRGQYRFIYVPFADYREELDSCKADLHEILDQHLSSCSDHAFLKGRNCVTNAEAHLGARFVLSLDLENFFDSLGHASLKKHLDERLLSLVLEDGAPRQGLSTSPLVANIAMLEVDSRIQHLCSALGEVRYTRYADDLTFSFQNPSFCTYLRQGVELILAAKGLKLNTRKTRVQDSRNGLIHITGVAIDSAGVRPTRATLRRIRAAAHQGNLQQLDGLTEWSRCKLPRVHRSLSKN